MQLKSMKKSIYVALTLLLTCAVLLISVSYAWLSIAQAPEITGIDTTVGANGSLEIALLDGDTYLDPGSVRTRVGASDAVEEAPVSNRSWGNVVDLGHEHYGLGEISMRPSRLNVEFGGAVNSNMLMFPTYGADGRFENFSADTVTATHGEKGFVYQAEKNYGVRAIGTTANLSPQQKALVEARAAVKAYTSEAQAIVQAMWKDYGPGFLNFYYKTYYLEEAYVGDEELASIRGLAVETHKALKVIEAAYRQAAVGYMAGTYKDEKEFETYRTCALDPKTPVEDIAGWDLFYDLEAASQAIYECDQLSGGRYTRYEINDIRNYLCFHQMFLGEEQINSYEAFANLSDDNILRLSPNTASMEALADYLGNYNAFFTFEGKSVEVRSSSKQEIGLLPAMSIALDNIQPATGAIPDSKLRDIYGFAMDLGFRCNAIQSDLLLQTEGALRVQDGSENPYQQHQGGGSYIRFTSEQLDTERIVLLMDAVRVGFVDRSGALIAVAKPNTSNFEETAEGVSAPLYLYDFAIAPDGALLMAERQKENNVIQPLIQGQPTVLSAVVWLDGDHVDNRLAATSGQSVTGTLNLQFASSANLVASSDQIIGEDPFAE